MFNKKLKLEIIELEERILQLEKRLEDYKKELTRTIASQSCVIGTMYGQFEELEKRIRKLERKGKKNNNE